jgi:hypothetical protein
VWCGARAQRSFMIGFPVTDLLVEALDCEQGILDRLGKEVLSPPPMRLDGRIRTYLDWFFVAAIQHYGRNGRHCVMFVEAEKTCQ